MNPQVCCTNLNGLLSTERAAIRCHLDAFAAGERLADRREAVRAFIDGYGGLMRELYCSNVCRERARCEVSSRPLLFGGLARKPAS